MKEVSNHPIANGCGYVCSKVCHKQNSTERCPLGVLLAGQSQTVLWLKQ